MIDRRAALVRSSDTVDRPRRPTSPEVGPPRCAPGLLFRLAPLDGASGWGRLRSPGTIHPMSAPDARRLAAAMVETDAMFGLDAVPVPAHSAIAADAMHEPVDQIPTIDPRPSDRRGTPSGATSRRPPAAARVASPPTTIASPPTGPSEPNEVELVPAIPHDAVPGDSTAARLAAIREHHEAHCPLCRNREAGRTIVFGEGAEHAEIAFVGEAPGEEDDLEGRPFVGPAGELLDRMIAALELQRDRVWVTNVVKTRPPGHRTPRPDEAGACGPWLANELLAIRPRVIVALGGTPAKHLLGTTAGTTRLRGVWATCRIGAIEIPVMPTFHPAFVLQQYTTDVRAAVWQDLQAAKSRAFDAPASTA